MSDRAGRSNLEQGSVFIVVSVSDSVCVFPCGRIQFGEHWLAAGQADDFRANSAVDEIHCNFQAVHGSNGWERNTMKCEEVLAMLNEYVDGTVDPAVCEELEQHMTGCNPCKVVVDTIRRTVTIYKAGRPYELPVKFRERLHEVLRTNWREKQAAK